MAHLAATTACGGGGRGGGFRSFIYLFGCVFLCGLVGWLYWSLVVGLVFVGWVGWLVVLEFLLFGRNRSVVCCCVGERWC